MTCSQCQHENRAAAKFCEECGTPLLRLGGSAQPASPYEDLQRSLTEAQEQQTATSDILRVISQSPTDVQPVFDAIVESAQRLLRAHTSSVFRRLRDEIHLAAYTRIGEAADAAFASLFPMSFDDYSKRFPSAELDWVDGTVIQVPDFDRDTRSPANSDLARARGFRSLLQVPMRHTGAVIGLLRVTRVEAGGFADDEINLLQTFADQAVIAIENVRLFTELQEKNEALTQAHAQVTESLEQQTATSEILRVISNSPTNVQPVFDAIVETAVRLCDARWGAVFRYDGALVHVAAHHNFSEKQQAAVALQYPMTPTSAHISGRAILTGATAQIPDIALDAQYGSALATQYGYRSLLAVPILRAGAPIGVIVIYRKEPGPFADQHIELLQTFADQAVIAIENVRLFKELGERNAELAETLARQTTTGEVLRAISRAQTDAQPVFDIIAESAQRLCGAGYGQVALYDGELLHMTAFHNISLEGVEALRRRFPARADRGSAMGRAIQTRTVVQIPDVLEDPGFAFKSELTTMGSRSILAAPMLRDGEPIGAIGVGRPEPGPFPDTQIALLQTFADQAVIAIENVRLFKELEARNAELTDTLARQMATGEVLRAISQVQTDAQPVFDMIAQSARRLCAAAYGQVQLYDGTLIHLAALESANPEGNEPIRAVYPLRVGDGSAGGRAIGTCAVVQIPDLLDERHPFPFKKVWEASGLRSFLAVPMLRDGEPLGTIGVGRVEPGQFPQTQIDLLQTFAEQAVIAIENVRLFKELEARTQDLTRSVSELQALGEVGQAISSTLDLETVLNTIVSRAVQISGLDGGVVFEYDAAAEEFVQRAMTDTSGTLAEARRTTRIRKGEGVLGRTAITLEPVQVADIALPGAYEGRLREILIGSGIRAILAVPMVREGQLIGCLGVTRNQPGEFPTETIELLRTFATQSALAIQNARLFHEIEDKSRQLEAASRHKSEFLANMSHELRTPLNAIIGFSEVLNERMFGELNEKQDEYLKDIYASGQHLLSLINDILDLSKIEAGRMELEVADFSLPAAIDNALILVRERASRRGIALGRAIDDRVGMIRGDERKVKQVLLNLLSNALKFTPEGGRIDVRAAMTEGMAEISVADTGVGIAPEDQEAIFEEFRQVGTADKKVEGTGLGLALSRKFIELHGGRIWVESQTGKGSTFTFTLPVGHGE
jgi:GAF domain-containing protein